MKYLVRLRYYEAPSPGESPRMAQDVVLPAVDAISPEQAGWLAKGRLRLAYWPTPVRVISWEVGDEALLRTANP